MRYGDNCDEHDLPIDRCGYCKDNEIATLRKQVEKLAKERDEWKSGFEAAASKYRNLKLQMQEIINVC